jgi:glyoxylase-like metal-dependent hydrolase (beta-lactamase superfamily II)
VNTAAFDVDPADRTNNFFGLCFPREEIARPEPHYVPHYLPGANPFVGELATKLRIPVQATLGGADTAYPEYREKLRQSASPPARSPERVGPSRGAQPVSMEPPPDNTVDVVKVQGNVWMISGAGGNIAVQAGEQGVVLVDTGAGAITDAVIAAIRGISPRPIRYIINTSSAGQHVGGNAALASLPGGSTTGAQRGALVSVIAQENVYSRMSHPDADGKTPFPSAAWPSDGYYAPRRGLIFNGEAIDIIHMPNAASDGDSIVYFRGSNVLVTGDIFTTTNLPMMDRSHGGSYAGSLTALNAMLDITVPDDLMEGGTYIIPGHGRICDEADLVEYRDMVHEVRDRLKKMITDDGMTLAQVKAERPFIGWEGRYSQPGWTSDMLIDAVYSEFAPKAPARSGGARGASR